jgi:hypothetical protein
LSVRQDLAVVEPTDLCEPRGRQFESAQGRSPRLARVLRASFIYNFTVTC